MGLEGGGVRGSSGEEVYWEGGDMTRGGGEKVGSGMVDLGYLCGISGEAVKAGTSCSMADSSGVRESNTIGSSSSTIGGDKGSVKVFPTGEVGSRWRESEGRSDNSSP